MPQNIYIYDQDIPVPEDVRHVKIPEGVTVIKANAFTNHSGLRSVTIPDSVTEIGQSAFAGCTGLRSVTIPGSVTVLGAKAFSHKSGKRLFAGVPGFSPSQYRTV